jgi:hypothetical protein
MGSAGKAGGSGTGGGGAAGGISVAAIGQSCDVSDAAACQAHASRDRVRCDGSQWIEDTPCSVDERCSTSQGAVCKAWIRDCTTADQKICVGAAIHSCGVDLLSSTPVSTCTGMTPYCEAGSCVAAACPTASSENLLRNPGFDTNVDFWIPADGQPLPIWSSSDSTQCAHSGSMKLSGPTSRVHQCASSPGADLIIGGEMIGNSRSSGAPEIELTFWSGTACDGDQLDDVTISFSSVQIGGAWRPVSSTYTPFQKGAASVDFAIFAGPDVNCDNLFLTKNPGHF